MCTPAMSSLGLLSETSYIYDPPRPFRDVAMYAVLSTIKVVVTDGLSFFARRPLTFAGPSISRSNCLRNLVCAILRIEPLVMRRIWDGDRSDDKQCNEIDTDNYMDQGTLESNIEAFCAESAKQEVVESGSVFTQTFNDGTPDRVVLTTEWPKGPQNYQVFWEECQYYMGVLKYVAVQGKRNSTEQMLTIASILTAAVPPQL